MDAPGCLTCGPARASFLIMYALLSWREIFLLQCELLLVVVLVVSLLAVDAEVLERLEKFETKSDVGLFVDAEAAPGFGCGLAIGGHVFLGGNPGDWR